MVIRVGKPDEKSESEGKREKRNNWSRSIWLIILVVFFILILLNYSVANLPGRYQATVINQDVLILDTAKGNIWSYFGNINGAVITYQGKLKAGEKVPERIVVKQRK